jgi:hypothetical protein
MHNASVGSASKEELDSFGQVVHFKILVHGFVGQELPVVWWVLKPGGEPVADKTLQGHLETPVTPHNCTSGGLREAWVKLPKQAGRFKIEVQLQQPNGDELDAIRTPTFTAPRPRTSG